MNMKRRLMSISVFAAIVAFAFSFTVSGAIDYTRYALGPDPTSVMVTFADGPFSRGFAWQTDASVTNGEVRLVEGDAAPAAFLTTPLVFSGVSKRQSMPNAFLHRAVAGGLRPGMRYSYRLGGSGRYLYGAFDVREPVGSLTAINFNDVQTKRPSGLPFWINTLAASRKAVGDARTVDFILNGGDFIDAWFEKTTNFVHGSVTRSIEWAVAADTVNGYYPSVPWINAGGNHDFWLYRAHTAQNRIPGVPPGCQSVDYGRVHFAAVPFDENPQGERFGRILDWLARDLSKTRAAGKTDWTIVSLHWGPYTTGDHGAASSTTNLVRRLAPLFSSNRVDLVLQAHDHTVSKTLPYRWDGPGWTLSDADSRVVNLTPAPAVVDGEVYDLDPCGTYYVSCGCAGHRIGENAAYARRDGARSFTRRRYKAAIGRLNVDSRWGRRGGCASDDPGVSMFGVLRIDGNRLKYDFYAAAPGGEPELYDTLRILKSRIPASVQSAPGTGRVAIHTGAQRRFLSLSPEKMAAEAVDPAARKRLLYAGWHPPEATLTFGGRLRASATVTLRERRTGACVSTVSVEPWRAIAWNLKSATEYLWEACDGDGTRFAQGTFLTEDATPRLMRIPTVANVRDLGGYVGLDGRRVRQGLVYRGAACSSGAYDEYRSEDETRAILGADRFAALKAEIEADVAAWTRRVADPAAMRLTKASFSGGWRLVRGTGRAPETVRPDGSGLFRLPAPDRTAGAEAEFRVDVVAEADGFWPFETSADWFYDVRVNGRTVVNRMTAGSAGDPLSEPGLTVPVPLRKGSNSIVCRVRPGERAWLFRARAGTAEGISRKALAEAALGEARIRMRDEITRVFVRRRPGRRWVSEEDRAYLVHALGIRTDLDLRGKRELFGCDASVLGVRFVPVEASAYDGVMTAHGRARMADALRVFLDARNYPVYFHCQAGQDRTGALAFVLNALLGVDEAGLWRDFLATCFWNPKERFDHADDFAALIGRMSAYPGATLAERTAGYVRSLGLTDGDIAFLRAFLLDGGD